MLFPRIETGFDLIDNLWQGFFKGRTYLLTGPLNSGKTTFCLQYAVKGLACKERVVFFTKERIDDILLAAEALQLDIAAPIENGEFLIYNLSENVSPISDELIIKTIGEISQIIEKEKPDRLIFDPITILLQFEDIDVLKQKITELIYFWEKNEIDHAGNFRRTG